MRARELGINFEGATGLLNAITDVPGLEVGMVTLISGEGDLIPDAGPVRTGVTAILPVGKTKTQQAIPAGIYSLNTTIPEMSLSTNRSRDSCALAMLLRFQP